MKTFLPRAANFFALAVPCLLSATPSRASFHLMQIEQAVGGVNGDTSAQAVQLRLRNVGQSLVSQARLVAYDAAGANPIVLKDFTADISDGAAGAHILIASAGFAKYTSAPLSPDFAMANLIPTGYLAAGRLAFQDDLGNVLWSLSFGGAGYTGLTTGSTFNDADGNFGPSFAGVLPSSGLQALQFQNAASALSANNAADYALTTGAATFTNNAGTSASLIAVTPTVSVNNPKTVNEGSTATPGSATFTVSLSVATDKTVTVNFQTAAGTAAADIDYATKTGTLTFAPGQLNKTVTVNFIGDAVAETNETFFLDIKTPTNATLGTATHGKAFIRNDDGPTISIANAVTVNEGNSGTTPQTFTVTLSAISTDTITVNFATANGTAGPADYTTQTGTLTFAPGETSKTITVLVKGDTTVEANEKYLVNLSSPSFAVLAVSQASGFIRNDDVAMLLAEPSK